MGGLFSFGMVISTLSVLPGGYLADRVDRRWLLVVGWAMCIPVPLSFAFATSWTGLIPGWTLFYLSLYCNPAMQSYVANAAPKEYLATAYSRVFSAFPLGSVISPTVGSWIASTLGMKAVFVVAAVFYLVSTIFMALISPQRPSREELQNPATGTKLPAWRAYQPLIVLCLGFAGIILILNLAMNFASPYLEEVLLVPLERVGLFGSVAALGGACLSPLLGRLADRAGARLGMVLGLIGQTLAFGLLLLAPNLYWAGLAFFLRGSQEGVRSLMVSQVAHHASATHLGKSYGIYNLVTGLTASAAPALGGWLYDRRPQLPFLATVAGSLLVVAVLVSLEAGVRRRHVTGKTV
ncbi:MAG: MFS transporter [Bacillota bacterium]